MSSKARSGKDDARGREEKLPPEQASLQAVGAIATEADVRAMRNKVYGHTIADDAWDKIKHLWMADLQWLIDQVGLDERRGRSV